MSTVSSAVFFRHCVQCGNNFRVKKVIQVQRMAAYFYLTANSEINL